MQLQWQPSASIENLKARAVILKKIRDFFAARDVLEVETPLMCHTSVTDPYIQSIPALFQGHPAEAERRHYLQTSPEFAMKRLLAAYPVSVYQITKAFRQGEIGQLHNPEFSMLEWYRIGFDHHQLMDEMDALLQLVLERPAATRMTYQQMFLQYLNIDPLVATVAQLASYAREQGIDVAADITSVDTWLEILMSNCIEPQLGLDAPVFVYDFPASQAALARIALHDPRVASRFEVYHRGMELANGFHELQNVAEQRKRFENNLKIRETINLNALPIDEYFLSALSHGLPNCAGVALGIDRLVMLALNQSAIQNVISFDFLRV